ncbi:MAG: energy-coupling factor transporter transmembrane component T, partial [Eubacterium sp.]
MTDVLSGTYVNISSPIHNINAKYKIPCFLAMIILTLAAKSYVVYIIDFLLLGICILISKLNIKHFISAISKLWLFYLIIFIMNSLFYSKGETVLSLWKINVTTGGIRQGAVIILNVIFVILWSKLFVLTSSPIE